MYHGVTKKDYSHINARHTTLKNMEDHFEYFKKYFNVISLKKIFELYRKGEKSSKPTIAITFDDGYKNNILNAMKVINKYKFPATFFISSIYKLYSQYYVQSFFFTLFFL